MSSTKELGDIGENLAAKHLLKAGYKIVERNWRYRKLEIDIIATLPDTIVFVEVKFRVSDDFGEPELFVTRKKQGLLIKAANEFLLSRGIELEARFDIISITGNYNSYSVKHMPGAFFPVAK